MFDTPSDVLYWSGAISIFIFAVALTILIIRLSNGLGKINQMLADVEVELPETVKNIRMIIEEARVLVADATEASKLITKTTEKIYGVASQVSDAVTYVNENFISKLKMIGDILSVIFGFVDKLGLTGKK
ncbi:MAG: hypothetical protein GY771_01515 [bacterium]|nr:hypothetical protein [bacterium]